MEPADQQPLTPPPSEHPRNRGLLLVILFIILAILTAVYLWWFVGGRHDATGTQPTTKPAAPSANTPAFDVATVVQGRNHVWDMAFLPSGEMLFTERAGTLSIVRANGQVSEVARISDIFATGEGGLMGLAVDPQFEQNRLVYACFNSTASDIRVARWRMTTDLGSLHDRKDIITGMPANTTTFPGRHSGCQTAFGPDGNLWVGTGDVAQGDTAVQPKSLGGKVLRVNREGKAVSGNLDGDFDTRIYSYGHRNTQGLAFFPNAKNGVLGLSVEHGSGLDDEVNELRKGNFGWAPPATGYDESVPMTDTTRFPDAIAAIWSSGDPAQAPSGAALIEGQVWKGWDGALAIAMLKTEHLKVLRLNAQNKVTKEERILEGEFGRLRAVVQGSDGSLYVSSSNGSDDKIIKLMPK